ncbi:MAG: hypothetical protein FJ128_07045 [Deltaproteobacteria bacterium]|nr:hypothetical protein [Deltaproteobacteria bacterium]
MLNHVSDTTELRRTPTPVRDLVCGWGSAMLLLWLLAAGLGCQAERPELSKGAAAFKKHVHTVLAALQAPLASALVSGDAALLDRSLEKACVALESKGQGISGVVLVLDLRGVALSRYPRQELPTRRFSDYALVQRVLRDRKTFAGLLYLPPGKKLYAVCSPIIERGDNFVGILTIVMQESEVQQKWELGPAEFLSIDFNL